MALGYDNYLSNGSVDRSANPTPGNKRGGLTNIVEKALGSIAKSGTSPISGVFGPGERVTTSNVRSPPPPRQRLRLRDVTACCRDEHARLHHRPRTPYGLAMVPVIVLSSRTALANRWSDLSTSTPAPSPRATLPSSRSAKRSSTSSSKRQRRHQTLADRHGLHNEFAFNLSPIT